MNLDSGNDTMQIAKETFYGSLNLLIALTSDPSIYGFKPSEIVLDDIGRISLEYFDKLKDLIK